MAASRSARKRVRQNRRRNLYNRMITSAMKTAMKRFYTAVQAKDPESAKKYFTTAVVRLDRASAKGVVHPNYAARHKSKMARRLNVLLAGAKV